MEFVCQPAHWRARRRMFPQLRRMVSHLHVAGQRCRPSDAYRVRILSARLPGGRSDQRPASAKARTAAGTPDPKWDFEPDTLSINKGTVVSVVDQGGEPHTFTEVKEFGGGFIPGLNSGQAPVSECASGFSDVSVAKTRLLQGSTSQITGLSKGVHHFQCCLHPWMRVTVDVK